MRYGLQSARISLLVYYPSVTPSFSLWFLCVCQSSGPADEKKNTSTPTSRCCFLPRHRIATTYYASRSRFSLAERAGHPTGCKSSIDPPTLHATSHRSTMGYAIDRDRRSCVIVTRARIRISDIQLEFLKVSNDCLRSG